MLSRRRSFAYSTLLVLLSIACQGAPAGIPVPTDSARIERGVNATSENRATASGLLRRLPAALIAALALRDPLALADTRLPRLADLPENERGALVEALASWTVPDRVAALAFLQVGTPYVLGPLGEETPPDSDPVIQFKTTDCAVLVLVSEALAHARDAGGERNAMAQANYRNGVISYDSRLHFTTDRLDVSPYDRDITFAVAGRATRSRRIILNRKPDGSRWIPIEWERERGIIYIPIRDAVKFQAWHRAGRIPDCVGVALVQEKRLAEGLDVVHETILWKGRTLLHGSSRIGRVVTIPWMDFLMERGRNYDGVVIYAFR